MSTFSDLDPRDGLTLRDGADIRLPLLQSLLDLYLQKPSHSAEEEQHFTELALRLLDQAEVATRVAVAQRLSNYPAAPVAVMHRLASDTDVVTAIVAEPAPVAEAATAVDVTDPYLSAGDLCELFFAASAEERRLILVNLAYAPPLDHPLTAPSPEAARQLETAALARNPDGFMRVLEQSLGIAPALAYRIVRDPLGEPILAVAKVLGVAPDALQRILLFLNPTIARSVQLVYELSTLYETVEVDAARQLVAVWRAAEPKPARTATFRPLHADSPNGNPRRTATTSVPSVAPGRDVGRPATASGGLRR
jgi:hypothetical protein